MSLVASDCAGGGPPKVDKVTKNEKKSFFVTWFCGEQTWFWALYLTFDFCHFSVSCIVMLQRVKAICAHTLLMWASEAILSTKVGRLRGFGWTFYIARQRLIAGAGQAWPYQRCTDFAIQWVGEWIAYTTIANANNNIWQQKSQWRSTPVRSRVLLFAIIKPAAHELPRLRYRSVAAGGAARVSQMVSPHTVRYCVANSAFSAI